MKAFLGSVLILLLQVGLLGGLLWLDQAWGHGARISGLRWAAIPVLVLMTLGIKINLEVSAQLFMNWLDDRKAPERRLAWEKKEAERLSKRLPAEQVACEFGLALAEARDYQSRSVQRDRRWLHRHLTVASLLDAYLKSMAVHVPPEEWAMRLRDLLESNALPGWIRDGNEYLAFVRGEIADRENVS